MLSCSFGEKDLFGTGYFADPSEPIEKRFQKRTRSMFLLQRIFVGSGVLYMSIYDPSIKCSPRLICKNRLTSSSSLPMRMSSEATPQLFARLLRSSASR